MRSRLWWLSRSRLRLVRMRAQGVEHFLRETLGVPLQQVASVYCAEGLAISEDDQGFLGTMMPEARERRLYWPVFADGVKFGGGFNVNYLQEHGFEFAQVYARIGIAHPMQYARAYGSATYGNWSLLARHPIQSYFVKLSSNGDFKNVNRIMKEYGLHNHSL